MRRLKNDNNIIVLKPNSTKLKCYNYLSYKNFDYKKIEFKKHSLYTIRYILRDKQVKPTLNRQINHMKCNPFTRKPRYIIRPPAQKIALYFARVGILFRHYI